ncbi:MAG: hypothetical protein ACP5OS_05165 [Leptospirillia bacterium]
MLDKDFAREFVRHYSKELIGQEKLNVEAVYQAFSTLGFKPERLGNAARTAIQTFMETSEKDLNQLLIDYPLSLLHPVDIATSDGSPVAAIPKE